MSNGFCLLNGHWVNFYATILILPEKGIFIRVIQALIKNLS